MPQLLLDYDEPHGYFQWGQQNASTYLNGRVCVVGDAAHAMTTWQCSGAVQAIEDPMIVGTLLAAVNQINRQDALWLSRSASQAYSCAKRVCPWAFTNRLLVG